MYYRSHQDSNIMNMLCQPVALPTELLPSKRITALVLANFIKERN